MSESRRAKRSVGRTRAALAKRLQVFLPEIDGFAVTWTPERIYAAQGFYRSSPFNYNGSYRWEAYGTRVSDGKPWGAIGSFATMTELLKSKQWTFSDNEIDCPTLPARRVAQKKS